MDIPNPINKEVSKWIKEAMSKATEEAFSKIDLEKELIKLKGNYDKGGILINGYTSYERKEQNDKE